MKNHFIDAVSQMSVEGGRNFLSYLIKIFNVQAMNSHTPPPQINVSLAALPNVTADCLRDGRVGAVQILDVSRDGQEVCRIKGADGVMEFQGGELREMKMSVEDRFSLANGLTLNIGCMENEAGEERCVVFVRGTHFKGITTFVAFLTKQIPEDAISMVTLERYYHRGPHLSSLCEEVDEGFSRREIRKFGKFSDKGNGCLRMFHECNNILVGGMQNQTMFLGVCVGGRETPFLPIAMSFTADLDYACHHVADGGIDDSPIDFETRKSRRYQSRVVQDPCNDFGKFSVINFCEDQENISVFPIKKASKRLNKGADSPLAIPRYYQWSKSSSVPEKVFNKTVYDFCGTAKASQTSDEKMLFQYDDSCSGLRAFNEEARAFYQESDGGTFDVGRGENPLYMGYDGTFRGEIFGFRNASLCSPYSTRLQEGERKDDGCKGNRCLPEIAGLTLACMCLFALILAVCCRQKFSKCWGMCKRSHAERYEQLNSEESTRGSADNDGEMLSLEEVHPGDHTESMPDSELSNATGNSAPQASKGIPFYRLS